ncbi:MAG: AAA family ATPase [Bacteroidetes bacterium]|nr:AAA family ATPase [Bacteroidota bacterium]
MKIESINIKNFKGIRSYEGDIGGKHVYLVGGNEQGKTSFIDAIWLGLSGKNCPPTPITDDGSKGLIEIDLGDFIARTKFKKGRPMHFELENKVFTQESERFIKAPRSYMEKMVGILDFNINDFFAKTDSEQVKYFAKVMGEDFSDIDSEIEEIAESRKFDKKKLKEFEAKNDYFSEEDAAKDLVDVVELSKKIEAETEKAATYQRINDGASERTRVISIKRAEIKQLEEDIEGLQADISAATLWQSDKANQPDEAHLKEMREELANSSKTNETIRKAKEAQTAENEANKLKKAVEIATEEIDELKAKKAKRISDKINIEGLEYSLKNERFLWNGLPFDEKQINTASQLISGMKIGATMLNELKILKVDASLIDKENFDKVLEWADDEGIELFVELVDREAAKLEVIVQDPKEY